MYSGPPLLPGFHTIRAANKARFGDSGPVRTCGNGINIPPHEIFKTLYINYNRPNGEGRSARKYEGKYLLIKHI